MTDVLDINQRIIAEGDLVLDSRGKVWRIAPTENTFRVVRTLWGIEQRWVRGGWQDGARLPVYGYAVAIVNEPPRGASAGARLYEQLYEVSAERAARRAEIKEMRDSSMAAVERVREGGGVL